MIVSQNEIEGLALKAARGAGYSWGMAEDVALATRWLAAHDFDAIDALDRLLADTTMEPGSLLCTIGAGTEVADGNIDELPFPVFYVSVPLMLIPFVARFACDVGRGIELTWHNAKVVIVPEGPHAVRVAAEGALDAGLVNPVMVGLADEDGAVEGRRARPGGRKVDAAAWARLEAIGARTYVPASDQSRIAGAGAGLSDND